MRNSYQNSTTGFLAIGQCDNLGEGQQDVWICHIDSLGDTLKTETLGGEENDYGHAVVLLPQLYSAFIAGYNSSYGIAESGNAYLGGVKVDMGLTESGECKVPRVLFVDNLIGLPIRDNNTGYVNREILNNTAKEQELINFCTNNKITHISIYRLGAMFDKYQPQLQQPDILQDRKDAQAELNSFINKCHLANIRVGYIADRDSQALMDVTLKNMGAYNYNVAGKFNYIQLEHEFWNTRSRDLEKILADNTYIIIDNTIDEHFTKLYSEHKALLNTVNTEKAADGNIWSAFDYVAYFYNRAPGATEHKNNVTPRKNKTKELANMVDAIFTTYYQEYDTTNKGLDFLAPSTSTDPQLIDYRNRLSDFGYGSVHNIIPTFSAEYYDYDSSPEVFCGKGKERDSPSDPWYYYDYLGKYLDGPDYNSSYSGNDFNDVESDYITQHDAIYQTPPTGFGNIANVNVSAFAWYRYSCVQGKTGFLDKSRVSCPAFTKDPLTIKEPVINQESKNAIGLFVHPNPSNGRVQISLSEPIDHRIIITNQLGEVVLRQSSQEIECSIDLTELQSGVYFIQAIFENQEMSTAKMIKL
ncbi:MAG: T9SS type A sorting domain-containing protein [Flavobacteriales bacterium]|nr:T9SS type A sorting domain-containing protein [Flavobacteriales bacterium]